METSEEAIAARRAEIAARVAAARAQQEASGSNSGNANMKKALSKKAQMKKALEEHMGPSAETSGGGGTGGPKKALSKKAQMKKALEEHTVPSAETLRRQAREMSRNPTLVRRANPEMFGNLTDAQIREHAKEMEKIASNPEMMDAAMKMQSLPESDKSAISRLQDGIAGKVPRDDEWIAEMIKLVKGQPDTLKMLFKGRVPKDSPMSEAQLLGIVDYVGKCSDWFLISAFHLIEWGIRMRAPAAAVYGMVDNATFGCAQYLVLLIVLFVAWYIGKLVWYLATLAFGLVKGGYVLLTHSGSTADTRDSTIQAQPEPSAREETPFVEL